MIGLNIDFVRPIYLIYFLCTLYHHTITIRILATVAVAATAAVTASSKTNNQYQCQQRRKGLAKADTTRLNDGTIPAESHILTHRRPQLDALYLSGDLNEWLST